MLALKAQLIPRESAQRGPSDSVRFPRQSACNLHFDYGRSPKPDITTCDTTYVLRENHELTVQAEAQFLAFCSKRLDELQALEFSQDAVCLSNFFKKGSSCFIDISIRTKNHLHPLTSSAVLSELRHQTTTCASGPRRRWWPSAKTLSSCWKRTNNSANTAPKPSMF